MEALMKQMSEAEWKKLSEQERQKRLAELRLKEKRLRQQGIRPKASFIFCRKSPKQYGYFKW